MASWKLADLFVEFKAKGVEAMSSAVAAVSKGVLGFAAAGLIGTTQGEHLRMVTQLFAREITSIFLPAIQAATSAILAATDWLRGLSGEQQDAILKWTAAAGAVMVFTKALAFIGLTASGPVGLILKLVAGLTGLSVFSDKAGSSFGRLGAAVSRIFSALAPIGDLFLTFAETLIGMVVPVLEQLATWIEEVAELLERLGVVADRQKQATRSEHRGVTATPGGMEGILDTYRRMQQTALRTDANYPKQQVEISMKQYLELQALNSNFKQMRPVTN